MKNITYRSIIVFLLFVIFIILGTGNSKAVLQSNGNTAAKYNVEQWISNIRKMEALGGVMGLSETLNSNLTSSSESNNIDVHMQKNTEYGALAILSASSYGNSNKIESGNTTTGNATGVVMQLNREWVAAGIISDSGTYTNAVRRYKDAYTSSYVAKNGDAIAETAGWHGSGASKWFGDNWKCGLIRSYSGSIFSYYAYAQSYHHYYDGYYGHAYSSRAVVVVGEGI